MADSSYGYTYRGKTTKALYRFSMAGMPATLLDTAGNPKEYGTVNGETVVQCNQSGEVRRGTKGSDPNNPYGPGGWNPSPWEQEPL